MILETLPSGWRRQPLSDVATLVRGIAFEKSAQIDAPSEGYVACLRTTNVQREVEWSDLWFVPAQLVRRDDQWLRSGDILISTANSYALVGKVAHVGALPMKATLGAFISLIRPLSAMNSKFLYYQLASAGTQTAIRSLASTTTNISNVSTGKLATLPVRVAPRGEQESIVGEIEKQFTRLDAGVAGLRHAQKQLSTLRRALLQSAVSGRLVPTSRSLAENEGRKGEPAADLLEAILQSRRDRWVTARGAGLVKGGYTEPVSPNLNALPPLPHGWTWATAEQLSDETRSITYGVIKLGDHRQNGVPTLRSSNVRRLRLEFEGLKRIAPELSSDYKRTVLRGGEVVLTVRGTLGGVVAVPATCAGFNISREVAMIALVDERLAPTVAAFIASPQLQRWLMSRTRGIAYTGINIATLKQLPIPLPPVDEQERINIELDRQLSIAEELSARLHSSVLRSAGLRRSILASAFAGRLHPEVAESQGVLA